MNHRIHGSELVIILTLINKNIIMRSKFSWITILNACKSPNMSSKPYIYLLNL